MSVNLYFYLIGLAFLLFFSYQDYKKKEVENWGILAFAIYALYILFLYEKSVIVGVLVLVTAIVAVYMWKLKIIGGADAKILPLMIPSMLVVSPNSYFGYINFLLVFLCIGTSYAVLYKNFAGKKKYVPFVPAIALTYLLFAVLTGIF